MTTSGRARPAAGARPGHLAVVVGTGTEVGKTWWAAGVLRVARGRGARVAARKPVQSFAAGDAEAGTTDADVLAAATGEAPADVCPPARSYAWPMAPPMAAAVLGRAEPRLAELLAALRWPPGVDLGLVEAAGGLRSPLAVDGDGLDLVAALAPDAVLVVADAGLGTLSAVRLVVDALARRAPAVDVVVALNRYDAGDDLHRRNRAWLADRDGMFVVVDPGAVAARWWADG